MPNSNNPKPQTPRLTAEEVEVRIWGFVVVIVTLILCFIVVALLYSVTFVTQPIKSMAPIDQAYTKMLNDIVLLIVGGIGGVMSKRAVSAAAKAMTPTQPTPAPCPVQPASNYASSPQSPVGSAPPQDFPKGAVGSSQTQDFPRGAVGGTQMPDFNWMGYKNPELDETWTPGPPPTTPPDHLESDDERAQLAAARKEAA